MLDLMQEGDELEALDYQFADESLVEEAEAGTGLSVAGRGMNWFPLEQISPKAALDTVQQWLAFLQGPAPGQSLLADASGYPLEQALELFAKELRRGASTIVTMKLPDGAPDLLGPVGLVAAIRAGEDLDLSLFGGDEWETIHLDFLATNPVIGWASELWSSRSLGERLREAGGGGLELLRRLLVAAAKAGRAVTVAPLDDRIKEQYRRLGFREDSLLDPSLMFWVPSEEVLAALHQRQFVYGTQ